MSTFTWIPFYTELAGKLLAYRDRQGELIALLKELKDQGIPVTRLIDKDKKDKDVPLKVMDPFTFFTSFNRKATDQNRQAILTLIKDRFQLKSGVPTDFVSIPIMHPMMSWFFEWEANRDPEDIAALWEFAEAIVTRKPEEITPALFNRCLEAACVTVINLTMAMYWMRPDIYYALDRKNCELLDARGVEHNVKDWASYLQLIKTMRSQISETPSEFSYAAYIGESNRQYWVFQCNPDRYDLLGALRAGVLKTWEVNQHKKEIHPGDGVIVWATGKPGGCYALATVISEVQTYDRESEDDAYWKGTPKVSPTKLGVELRMDEKLWESPITKEQMGERSWFKDFPGGRQGTNFEAKKAHFEGILELARERTSMRYWVYAPGPDAKYWDECWDKGIMIYGADELPDLRSFSSKEAIEAALLQKKGKDFKKRPTNDARACWEFSRVVQPNDVVIAKQGREKYIGYGVVTGPYEYDEHRPTYRNVHKIRWIKKDEWTEKGSPIVLKTLTDITKYPEYVEKLKKLIGISDAPTAVSSQPMALNTILYGPPGTGKTWALRNEYMTRFTEQVTALSKEGFATELVADLAWWQVISMVMLDIKKGKVSDILAHPLLQACLRRSDNHNPRAAIWAHIQIHTKLDCTNVKYARRSEPLLFSKDDLSVWSIDEQLAAEEVPELVETLARYRAYVPGQSSKIKRYEFTTFHQSYSYEDFIEGIKPVMSTDVAEELTYEIKPGIFKSMVNLALKDPAHDYALIIDEISRGNVANIFGELITLIEDDKREGAPNELSALLPYSREKFSVPKNLYIIGAMNTADRSVEALDTALRRRFTFVTVPPRPDLVRQPASLGIDLQKMLHVINERIERISDKDHCIGHSYFMGLVESADPLADLQRAFASKVLPLMEEYFYGDPAKIGMVLGKRFVTRKENAIDWASGDWGADDFEDRPVYVLNDPMNMTAEDFRSIYE